MKALKFLSIILIGLSLLSSCKKEEKYHCYNFTITDTQYQAGVAQQNSIRNEYVTICSITEADANEYVASHTKQYGSYPITGRTTVTYYITK